VTDLEVQSMVGQLAQKVDDLETMVRKILRVVGGIDDKTALTVDMVNTLLRKSR